MLNWAVEQNEVDGEPSGVGVEIKDESSEEFMLRVVNLFPVISRHTIPLK
jgi:hypothetical protein